MQRYANGVLVTEKQVSLSTAGIQYVQQCGVFSNNA